MKVVIRLLSALFYLGYATLAFRYANAIETVDSNVRKVKSLPVVDAFISGLEREPWSPDDGACLRATLDMLRGVRNNTLWASWIWDSMQLPTGSLYGAQAYLGNYDQCLQAPWSADHIDLRFQYCLVELRGEFVPETKSFGPFADTEQYYQYLSEDDRHFNQHFFGVCLPSICSPSSVTKISRVLLQFTHLPDGGVFLEPRNCHTAGETLEYSTGYYVFWTVIGTLCVMTITSTFWNYLQNFDKSSGGLITKSFCLKTNFLSLFTVSDDDVTSIHGLRIISALMLVFGHEGFFSMMFPTINSLDINKMLNTTFGRITLHLDIAVDTFFALSGLLLVRGLMMGKQRNLFHTIVKRYIRLIGPLVLCVLFFITISEYVITGPMAKKLLECETYACPKYWWKTLLMANTDTSTLCHGVTWYISCDFQMTVIGTFFYYLYKRNKKLGFTAFAIVTLALTVNLGLNVYWNQLDMLPFTYKTVVERCKCIKLNYTYFSTLSRAGPYFVGMVMGYIMYIYKPNDYRKVIDRKWSMIISKTALLAAGVVLSLGAIFADRPYDPLEAAVVLATNRVIWAIAVCCIIAVCEYGSLILIPSVLCRREYIPLSKLSYGMYLLHPIIMQAQKFSARTPATYSVFSVIINGLGVFVLASGCSLIVYLILEAPLINISNALFDTKSNNKSNQINTNQNKGSVWKNNEEKSA